MTLEISNSEIQLFKWCRRTWYLTYYRCLGTSEVLGTASPLGMGSKIHKALEDYYISQVDPVQTIEELYLGEVVGEELHGTMSMADKFAKEYELAKIMVEGYLEWAAETGIDDNHEVIGVEEALSVPLIPATEQHGAVNLIGKLDVRMRRISDGAVVFRDWKSYAASSFDRAVQILPMDEQMKTYSVLERLHNPRGTFTDGGMITVLKKVKRTKTAKPPFFYNVTVGFNRQAHRSMYYRLVKVCEEIRDLRAALDAGGDPLYLCPPRPSWDCAWKCPFVDFCPHMDESPDYESIIQDHFIQIDPYARYGDEKKGGE